MIAMRQQGVEYGGEAGAGARARPEVRGKFLWLGNRKCFVRGVSYGPFQADAMGSPFPGPALMQEDFARMHEAARDAAQLFRRLGKKCPDGPGHFRSRFYVLALFRRLVLRAATADLPHVGRFGAVDFPITDDPLFIDQWIMRGRGARIAPVAVEL